MSTEAVHRPTAAEQPAAADLLDPRQQPGKGPEDHAVLLFLGVLVALLLAFGGMVLLTELGGGSGYVR